MKKFNKFYCTLMLSFASVLSSTQAADMNRETSARLKALSKEMKVDVHALKDAVYQAEKNQKVIDSITRPWEAKPWYKYRTIFLTDERIEDGARFMEQNIELLKKAEKKYGVEKEIIVAILGVETFYGTRMGNYKVLDALYTLGFHYPKRSEYFSKEFANFVKLANEQGWDYSEPLGSYAGAMGMGQFMPSSYIHYAVDFDKNGTRDLFRSKADAIGSVANYFQKSKWHHNEPVVYRVRIPKGVDGAKLASGKLALNTTWGHLTKMGISLKDSDAQISPDVKVKVIALDIREDKKAYYVVMNNFISITRYNTSPLYAMAVYELSQAIKEKYRSYKKRR